MTYLDVIKKLVGPIDPIGETSEDERRYLNLVDLCELVDELVSAIDDTAYYNRNKPEYSKQRAGKYADDFLTKLGITK